ncbi:uncharacterized protein CTRU02_201083 [Colletotrichum truncatum]|uniref:Uncharacterized protein n=1 Tax=Colletotrichum truncatum TaxID=5467 RepID=A0ACC3ZGF4_COLTU|nr:uncharacterized protein CTRU02_12398 [Colletotrichum truncatum]KAF6784692.1 hypothetical protein CTRU02_12398 [Colletotrichum truncatum]
MSFFSPVRGHRSSKKREKRPRDPKQKEGSSSKQEQSTSSAPFSFLFVVNEFKILGEEHGFRPLSDRWGSPQPPPTSEGYGNEVPGRVWRYQDGVVNLAPEFTWFRGDRGLQGRVEMNFNTVNEYGEVESSCEVAEVYSTHSVFNCWRFLPCIYTDADVSAIGEMEINHRWSPLEFDHDKHERGMTWVCGDSERHVAGRGASWMPSLLPETYAAPTSHAEPAPPSKGLGGTLGVIIGLMALSRKPGHADDVFTHNMWRNNRWYGHPRHHRADPGSKGPPRGVMVQICYDSYNPEGSNYESILDFEQTHKALIG